VVGQDCPFDDVLPDQWYTEAIIWANEKGVACGYGNGFFGTDDNITREQIVVILQNYVRLRGFYPADNPSDSRLHTFVDADLISPWAVAAMEWAVETALLKGKDSATLAPQATATRAEAAVIISRVSNLEIREL